MGGGETAPLPALPQGSNSRLKKWRRLETCEPCRLQCLSEQSDLQSRKGDNHDGDWNNERRGKEELSAKAAASPYTHMQICFLRNGGVPTSCESCVYTNTGASEAGASLIPILFHPSDPVLFGLRQWSAGFWCRRTRPYHFLKPFNFTNVLGILLPMCHPVTWLPATDSVLLFFHDAGEEV